MPTETNVTHKFLQGMDLPEVIVRTSKSGSMTQEIFYDYCKHFVASLHKQHELIILFLDGHTSRWNMHALKYLMDTNVCIFFFASRTSNWAQPNDCGLNKRVHWKIVQGCKIYRRGQPRTTHGHFNEIFSLGWTIFVKAEADDLLECFDNNATRTYERTGVYPLNPYAEAWTDAIGLGAANPANKCDTLSYEIVSAQEKPPVLNATENKLLQADLSIDAKKEHTSVKWQ
jgi:hypothetical protein